LALLRRQSHTIKETIAWGREANRVEKLLSDALETGGQRRGDGQEERKAA
jgi:hypothetical protein